MNDLNVSRDHSSTELRQNYLDAMSRAAFSVSLVTTNGIAGRAGLTVSAMTSVSADPPSMLVCVDKRSQFGIRIRENNVFAVSILTFADKWLADVFAGRVSHEEKFDNGNWTNLTTEAPILETAVSAFDCSVIDVNTVGSHEIVVGKVLATRRDTATVKPLVHHNRTFVGITEVSE